MQGIFWLGWVTVLVSTFLINHFGDLYQKDLGPDTARIAGSLAVFNPDKTWSKFDGID